MLNLFPRIVLSLMFGCLYSGIAYFMVYGQLISFYFVLVAWIISIILTLFALWVNKRFIFNEKHVPSFLIFMIGFVAGIMFLNAIKLERTILLLIFVSLKEIEPPYILASVSVIFEFILTFLGYFIYCVIVDINIFIKRRRDWNPNAR